MKILFFKILAHLKYISTQEEVLDPFVSTQPYVNYYILNKSSDQSKDDPEMATSSEASIEDKVAFLEIKLIIDYRNYLQYFKPFQTNVLLKRYIKKKTLNEAYVEDLHKPVDIMLPPEGRELDGLTLDIHNEKIAIRGENEKLKTVTKIVLHTTRNIPPTDTNIPFVNIGREFIEYMINGQEEILNFGFKFFIEITSYSDDTQSNIIKKTISSQIFCFEFVQDAAEYVVVLTDINYYHTGPTPPVVKQGRLSKFMAAVRKNVRLGNRN